jgi:hypothetical protein
MDRDDIAICDDATDFALGIGERLQEGFDVGAQALDTVLGGGSVLRVGVADVAGDRAVNVTIEMRFLLEGEHGSLVLLGNGFGRHDDLQSYCRRPS